MPVFYMRFLTPSQKYISVLEAQTAAQRLENCYWIHLMAYDDNDHGGCMSTHIVMARELWGLQN